MLLVEPTGYREAPRTPMHIVRALGGHSTPNTVISTAGAETRGAESSTQKLLVFA
jgi:hypothetical protein